MKKSTIIIIVVVTLLAIWGVSGYNGLVTMDENVSGQTLEGVVEARSKATQMTVDANDLTPEKLAEYQKAQGAVTSALGKLLAITENYPDLKLPGAPSPVGRYGKPHQRGTYQLQQCGEEIQYGNPPFPQKHSCRSFRL